ncbi:uncharacterized protein TNIN_132411 [Trichonephila inaurata madagascariensis]|uniref:Uncharacterized protein n=1 Tax=Trichonephila inaurata madagascariensis TaxID=2747483 RepID=A0A8X7C1A4_9ARAC|nr:uncharacterized protein TNIN_132411 [Trichonephila inaurata madagascariensis]
MSSSTAEDGKFRGEIIKCVEMMPLEMQIILKKCGAKYLNGTSCEYRTIISEMCDDPKYSQNVTDCIQEFKQSQHHNSSHGEENEEHEQEHHHHDHERHDNVEDDDDDDESEEEIHVLHDLSVLISKTECNVHISILRRYYYCLCLIGTFFV